MSQQYIERPREGIVFWGEAENLQFISPSRGVYGPKFVMGLYIEGQPDPIYRRPNRFMEILDSTNVYQTFQRYVMSESSRKNWRFRQVKDPDKRLVLLTYAKEKTNGKRFEDFTYRFLPATEVELSHLDHKPNLEFTFILTSDRQDIEKARLKKEQERLQAQIKLDMDRKRYESFFEDVEVYPLNESEEGILERIKQTPVIHIFNRGVFHGLSIVDTDVIAYYEDYEKGWGSRRSLTDEEKTLVLGRDYLSKMLSTEDLDVIEHSRYSPTRCSMSGGYFLALLVRGGIASRREINKLFEEMPDEWFRQFGDIPKFDILKWWQFAKSRIEWPSFDGNGESMRVLAKILDKGIQKYAWDGGYGDISESWKTVYIDPQGNIWRENYQTYGGGFI